MAEELGDTRQEVAWSLGSLADPSAFQWPVPVPNSRRDEAYDLLRDMALIRVVELRIAKGRKDGDIGGPVHLAVGQEAAAVGVAAHLRKSDMAFGAHRSHAHVLAMGADPRGLLAEVCGRATGLSRGFGGSMHLWDEPSGFMGSVPIVAGTVPLAVGAGLAAKLKGTDDVAVAFLGDGAVEEGVVGESFNLAKMLDSRTLFVVENNQFSSHMHISERQHYSSVARIAEVYGLEARVVDGNNALEVSDACSSLLAGIRSGSGPAMIEAVTYRWLGHVDWRDDQDVGVNRSADDLREWKARDPIRRIAESLFSDVDLELRELYGELESRVERLWVDVQRDPLPDPAGIETVVFAEGESARA